MIYENQYSKCNKGKFKLFKIYFIEKRVKMMFITSSF